MREFLILLKYGMAFSHAPRRGKKRVSLYSYIVPAAVIGLVAFYTTRSTFSTLSQVDPLAPKIFINFWTTLLSMFFIVGFIGLSINSFTLNEEIEFLLNLPIRRTVLLFYQIFVSTLTQFFALFLYIGIYASYTMVSNNSFLVLFKGIIQLIFMISLASILTILIGKRIKKATVRKIVMVINIVTPFLIFLLIGSNESITKNAMGESGILRYIAFSFSNYNFLTWAIKDGIFPIISLVISIIFVVSFVFLSKDVEFSQSESKSGKTKDFKLMGSGVPIKAIYIKDIKTALRIDQFIFFIIYPVAFGIFMAVMNNDIFTAIFASMPVIIIYVAIESAILTAKEYLYIETVKTYPISLGKILMPKIIIPTTLNTIILLVEFIIFSFLKGLQFKFFIFLPISFVLLIMNSLMGAYQTVKNPPKTENISRVLGFGSIMLVEGITLGSVFAVIFPLMKLFANDFESTIQRYLVGYLLPIATLIACLMYSRYLYLKLIGYHESQ